MNRSRNKVRLPLVLGHLNRDSTATKDQRLVNCYGDISKNPIEESPTTYVTKRPGFSSYSATTAGSGRGVWSFAGAIYHVTGTTLYRNNVAIKTLTSGYTGLCGAVEVVAPTEKLFLCDGFTAWLISPDGSIEDVEKSFNRWTASTVLEVGDKIIPTAYASQTEYYVVTTAGTTHTSEPTWGGATVTSGTVVFTKVGSYTGARRYTNRAYSLGDLVQPSTESGMFYKVVKAGTTTAEPTWSLVIGSISTQNGVEFENMGYYGGFPSPHIPQPVCIDNYIFLVEEGTADIYNSRTGTPWSWNGLEFISADSFSGEILAIARYNNYLVAYGADNVELFYDAANETGSPLSRHDSFLLQTGIASPYAIIQSEQILAWVGTSKLGGRTIWLMDGFEPKEISNQYINRLLLAETDATNIRGYGIRLDGHSFFVINLPSSNKTLVLDIGSNFWYEWSINSAELPFVAASNTQLGSIVQHTSGKLYLQQVSNTQDIIEGTTYPIDMSIVTAKTDFGNRSRKFIWYLDVIGDQINTDITLQWSDDDYQTYNTGFTLNMLNRPRVARGGSTRRRAFKITHTGNSALRLEALELVVTQGQN